MALRVDFRRSMGQQGQPHEGSMAREIGTFSSVAVLLVTYESDNCIATFLDGLKDLPMGTAKLYWCDNGSSLEARSSYLTSLNKADLDIDVSRVWSDANMGFAAAVNKLIPLVEEEVILLINPDVTIDLSWIKASEGLITSGQYDVVSSRAISNNGSIDRNIQRFPGPIKNLIGEHGAPTDINSIKQYYVDFSCIMLRRSLLSAHGVLANFFMYGEDVDYMLKLRDSGQVRVHIMQDRYYLHQRSTSSSLAGLGKPHLHKSRRVTYANAKIFSERYGFLARTVYLVTLIMGAFLRLIFSANKQYHYQVLKYASSLSIAVLQGRVFDCQMH